MYKSEIYFIGKRKQPWPEIIKEQNIVICTVYEFNEQLQIYFIKLGTNICLFLKEV